MGCAASKGEDLPLVALCRQRRSLIRSAADHRFSLAAAHVAYFRQLVHVGDSLLRFVDEELVVPSSGSISGSSPSSPSSLSSPVLTLPSDPIKKKKPHPKKKANPNKAKATPSDNTTASVSHGLRAEEERERDSHLRLSSSFSTSGSSDLSSSSHHHHHHHHDDGHIEIDEDDEEDDEDQVKARKREIAPSPQPGISYIPAPDNNSNFGLNFNYPFDPSSSSSSYPNYPYYPPPPSQMGAYDNGGFNFSNPIPPPYYAPPPNYYYPGNNNGGGDSYGAGGASTSFAAYYMKKSSTRIPSVIYEEPKGNPIYTFSDYPNQPPVNGGYPNYSMPNGGSGYFGFSMNSEERERQRGSEGNKPKGPPTPPSPKVSAWDYFNPFDGFDSGGGGGVYPGYYGPSGYGYESNSSSPDSREVREREGIPDLEEETESEVIKETYKEKRKVQEEVNVPKGKSNKTVQFEGLKGHNSGQNGKGFNNNNNNRRKGKSNLGEGTSNSKGEPEVASQPEPEPETVEVRDAKSSSPETEMSGSTSVEEVSVKKKGVSFEGDGSHLDIESSKSHLDIESSKSHLDIDSSKPSSFTTLSAQGTRDLREVVREIKDEFEAATDYGKEVSVLLEVGKEPYHSRSTVFKVMLAKVCTSSYTSNSFVGGQPGGLDDDFNSRSLAATLEKLYVWEKKLYKEVKDEERLRVLYEKQCKRLKNLDERGAENSKVEAAQFEIRKLLTKLNVSVKAVDSISTRIHKLRDEELQPQLKELIYGLRKMWKLMLKCHHKQFQAILESKTRALKANTGLRRDSSVRATIQLEAELLKWCQRFNNWIEMQRSYAKTLNGWLEKCLHYEPEITEDGVVPFSPARIGAPPVFVICHDWKQAMERVSNSEVQTAMSDFATSLHQLWERQDEEQRRRLEAEKMYKDFEKQIRAIRLERQRKGQEHDETLSDKNSLSMVASESGVSPLDDLKVDLDSMRQRVKEERAGHKEAVKLVHDAVSRSIQAGLIPIFEALESFTSEASKAFNDVRLEHVSNGS